MRILLSMLVLGSGFAIGIHLAMNARAADLLENVAVNQMFFWLTGFLVAAALGAASWSPRVLANAKQVPWYLYTAGAIGAPLILSIAWTIPRLGAGRTMVFMLTGQIVGGMVVSHFGWFGMQLDRVTVLRLVGVSVMLLGASLTLFSR